tara:strand:- start:296 stop:469 length:174 start_codon:yes stop_codon:yes gene_type:complete
MKEFMLEVIKRGHVYISANSIEEAREKFKKNPDKIYIEWEEEITDEKPSLTGQGEQI